MKGSSVDRSAVALMVVVICLIVVATIIGATLRQAMLNHRLTKQRRSRTQAVWLAESAIERAVYSLQQEPTYRGETWEVSAEELRGRHDGAASIKVSPDDANEGWQVEVVATFPADVVHQATVRKQIVVNRLLENRLPED